MVKKAIGNRHEKEKRRKDVELGFGRSWGGEKEGGPVGGNAEMRRRLENKGRRGGEGGV